MTYDEPISYEDLLQVIKATKARIAEISLSVDSINAQVQDADVAGKFATVDAYEQWRGKAIYKRGQLIHESARLRRTLADYQRLENSMRQEHAQLARQERRQRIEQDALARTERRTQALLANPDLELVQRLYAALCRMYKKTGQTPTERDKQTLDLAHVYLTEKGVFSD